MITHITKGATMEYRGSQNDVKPLNVANGSVFIEIESGAKYLYDAENSLWIQWNEAGISDEKIQDAVDNYLEEHPVSGEDLIAREGISQLSESILEFRPGIKIIVFAPFFRFASSWEADCNHRDFNDRSGRQLRYSDWIDGMIEVCGYYGVPCVDMLHSSCINEYTHTQKMKLVRNILQVLFADKLLSSY